VFAVDEPPQAQTSAGGLADAAAAMKNKSKKGAEPEAQS
jgi:hypothetical protein